MHLHIREPAFEPPTMFYLLQYSITFSSSIVLSAVILSISLQIATNTTDINNLITNSSIFNPIKSIYYNPFNNQQLEITIDNSKRLPNQEHKFSSRGIPCECHQLICKCCAGIKIGSLDFNQTCIKIQAVPEEFSIQLLFIMNDKIVMRHVLSGKNPPPICPPLPFLPPIFKLCIRFYNIRLVDNIFKVCTNFEVKIDRWSVFILHFDCMHMNITNGGSITWITYPDNIETIESTKLIGNNTPSQFDASADSEIYDKVSFEQSKTQVANNNSYGYY